MQSDQDQHNANDKSNRDHFAHERGVVFLDLRFDKRIQSAVNLGHWWLLPATLITQGASGVLLFWANGLIWPNFRNGNVEVVEKGWDWGKSRRTLAFDLASCQNTGERATSTSDAAADSNSFQARTTFSYPCFPLQRAA
jgi:hypothetical protein